MQRETETARRQWEQARFQLATARTRLRLGTLYRTLGSCLTGGHEPSHAKLSTRL